MRAERLQRACVAIGLVVLVLYTGKIGLLVQSWRAGVFPSLAALAPHLIGPAIGAALVIGPLLWRWAASGVLWRILVGAGALALVALPFARSAARPALVLAVVAGLLGAALVWRDWRRSLRVIVAAYPRTHGWDTWLRALPGGRDAGRAAERWVGNQLDAALPRDRGFVVLHNVDLGRSGDIDAVVLGPSGIWVVEAKLWSGEHTLPLAGGWCRAAHSGNFTSPQDQLETLVVLVREYVARHAPELAGVAGAVPQGLLVWVHPYSTVLTARGRRHRPIILRMDDATRRIRRRAPGRRLAHAQIATLTTILAPRSRPRGWG